VKIGILSVGPRLYSTRRLREAAQRRGHSVRVLNTLKFAIHIDPHEPDVMYSNRPLTELEAIIPRIGASITSFGCAVVRQFEQMGVFTLNSSHAIAVSRDKLRSLQILSRREIGLPPTEFVRRREDILPAIERCGGVPIVIKLIEGTQGVGVILAESRKVAEAIIETLQGAKQNVLLQKFVAESKGRDLRVFVVGGRVVAAMRRTAVGQEFRSNLHRGGTAEPVKLSEEQQRVAVRAAQIMGLQVAGVDLLEASDGLQIMEVNSSPGLEGIERATGIDVADAIIDHLEAQQQFPEVDVRQRLSLGAGYTVAEIRVMPNSSLANRTLAEAQLRERDVVVLNITRGGLLFPTPTGDHLMLAGDIMLCYGKMPSLRALLPEKKPRRRRKKLAVRTSSESAE